MDDPIKPKELTLREVRELFLRGPGTVDDDTAAIDDLVFDDLTLSEMAFFCGVEADRFDELTDSELTELYKEVKRLNPLFFGMRQRRKTLDDVIAKEYPEVYEVHRKNQSKQWLMQLSNSNILPQD